MILERRCPIQELIGQHTKSPMVHTLVVCLPFEHLRGKVVQGAAHGLTPGIRCVHAPAKVANFEFAVDTEQEVFGLDITMNDVLRVEVDQRIRHLVHISRTPSFGKACLSFTQLPVELSLSSELDHEEDAFLVVEVAIQPQDIRVAKVCLDFNFPADLLLDSGFDDFGLVEGLESDDVLGLGLGTDHVDSSEPALAERTTNVEVVQRPFPSGVFPTGNLND